MNLCMLDDAVAAHPEEEAISPPDSPVISRVPSSSRSPGPSPVPSQGSVRQPDPDGPGSVVESVSRLLDDHEDFGRERQRHPIFPPSRGPPRRRGYPAPVPSLVAAPRHSPDYPAPRPPPISAPRSPGSAPYPAPPPVSVPGPHLARLPVSGPRPSRGYPAPSPVSAPLQSPDYPVPSPVSVPGPPLARLPVSAPRRSHGYPVLPVSPPRPYRSHVPRHVSVPRVRDPAGPMSAGAPPHHQYMQALMAAQGAAYQRELQLQAEAHQRELELTRRVAALEARAELLARHEPLTMADAMQAAFARAMGPPQQPQHPQYPQPYPDDEYGYYNYDQYQ